MAKHISTIEYVVNYIKFIFFLVQSTDRHKTSIRIRNSNKCILNLNRSAFISIRLFDIDYLA